MNRLGLMHNGVRHEFPVSMTKPTQTEAAFSHRTFAPLTSFYLGIVAFMGCSAVVILTAGLIALRIQ